MDNIPNSEFRVKFNLMIENVKRKVTQTVTDSVCREIDSQADILYDIFAKQLDIEKANKNKVLYTLQSEVDHFQQTLNQLSTDNFVITQQQQNQREIFEPTNAPLDQDEIFIASAINDANVIANSCTMKQDSIDKQNKESEQYLDYHTDCSGKDCIPIKPNQSRIHTNNLNTGETLDTQQPNDPSQQQQFTNAKTKSNLSCDAIKVTQTSTSQQHNNQSKQQDNIIVPNGSKSHLTNSSTCAKRKSEIAQQSVDDDSSTRKNKQQYSSNNPIQSNRKKVCSNSKQISNKEKVKLFCHDANCDLIFTDHDLLRIHLTKDHNF